MDPNHRTRNHSSVNNCSDVQPDMSASPHEGAVDLDGMIASDIPVQNAGSAEATGRHRLVPTHLPAINFWLHSTIRSNDTAAVLGRKRKPWAWSAIHRICGIRAASCALARDWDSLQAFGLHASPRLPGVWRQQWVVAVAVYLHPRYGVGRW